MSSHRIAPRFPAAIYSVVGADYFQKCVGRSDRHASLVDWTNGGSNSFEQIYKGLIEFQIDSSARKKQNGQGFLILARG
ncbi:MAG: hypothetical protein P4N60_21825 [Verrucomicrobiae bacterium]|nr:hypothetical protein [Verrucomicrobiae bacterium]